jgi:hypothetical protein
MIIVPALKSRSGVTLVTNECRICDVFKMLHA